MQTSGDFTLVSFCKESMSHQLCRNCGSNQFELLDGRVYCTVCQSQNIALQMHVSFANEGNAHLGQRLADQTGNTSRLDETIPKIEIIEGNQATSRGLNLTEETLLRFDDLSVTDDHEPTPVEPPLWSTYDVYSEILRLQVNALLTLNHFEEDKHEEFVQCTFLLYLRYLSANGILDTSEKRSSTRQEERRIEVNHSSKLFYNDRCEYFAQFHTRIVKKNFRALNLDILIGLIHCSSTLIQRPISMRQLIRWINSNQIPYYNIQSYLPQWMHPTGRDRFNLEKMQIHVENFFMFYQEFLRPIVKTYVDRCICQSTEEFVQTLLQFCSIICRQVYFPFDQHTQPWFHSICQCVIEMKSKGRRFVSTSIDLEMTALIILIISILLRSINDRLIDEFLHHHLQEKRSLFSYSTWMKNLNALNSLESRLDYQFFGRSSVLQGSRTANHSKKRYLNSLSKVFQRAIQLNHDEDLAQLEQEIQHRRQILMKNSEDNSLVYAFDTEAFFRREFPQLSSKSVESLLENIAHHSSPSSFSLVDKSEFYESCLSLTRGATITQIEDFYLLYHHFDATTSSRFSLHHLLSTLTRFCSIPYNEHFYSFFSRFLKTFAFRQRRLHHYFYQSTSLRRTRSNAV